MPQQSNYPNPFFNQYANIRGHVTPISGQLHYFSGRTSGALEMATRLFGVESPSVRDNFAATRCATSLTMVKAYNFTRQEVTHVDQMGVRSAIYNIEIEGFLRQYRDSAGLVNHGKRGHVNKTNRVHQCIIAPNDELFRLSEIVFKHKIDVRGHVLVVQYKRIIAPTKNALRVALRSLAITPEMVDYYERDPIEPITQEIGIPGYYRDVIFFSLVSEEDLADHPAVLDTWSGQQFTFESVEVASAHLHDERKEVLDVGSAKDLLKVKEKAIMATYVYSYKTERAPEMYYNDAGTVIRIPQEKNEDRKAGFYKTWHEQRIDGKIIETVEFMDVNAVNRSPRFYDSRRAAEKAFDKKRMLEMRNATLKYVEKVANTFSTLFDGWWLPVCRWTSSNCLNRPA